MAVTLSEVTSLLSRYAGSGNSFNDRLNLVRARYLQWANCPGSKQQIILDVFSDAAGHSIVTLPREYKTILEGAILATGTICTGQPVGVQNEHSEFNLGGLGYGGQTMNFMQVNGRYSCWQEWTDPMRIRFRFEQSESLSNIYISGTLDGDDVWALNSGTWEKREAVPFFGTVVATSTKYYDAQGFKIKKPVTNGRVSAYTLDDNGVETLVGVYEPTETLVRWKRYKVPQVEDVSATVSTSTDTTPTTGQSYTKAEIDNMFADSGTINVSAAGTHDLTYDAYFLRIIRIIATSSTYTHNFTLDNATVKVGGTLRIKMEVAAADSIILNFYDNSTGGTLLQTVTSDPDNATYQTLVFSYGVDTAWHYEGREL